MDQVTMALDYFHNDHKRWINEIEFAKQEVSYFEHQLEELVRKTSERDVLRQLEQYQNRFIREREVMDHLQHDIKKAEHELANAAEHNSLTMGQFNMDEHLALGQRMVDFGMLYGELRQSFNQFLMRALHTTVATE